MKDDGGVRSLRERSLGHVRGGAVSWTLFVVIPFGVLVMGLFALRQRRRAGSVHGGPGPWTGPLVLPLVRPDDSFDVRIELLNLHVEDGGATASVARRPAHVVVHFPAQHLAEAPDGAPAELPVAARLAAPTRLSFRVREGVEQIELDVVSLLTQSDVWGEPDRVPEIRDGADIAAPTATQSSIEVPFRLVLSPDAHSRWVLPARPPTEGSEGWRPIAEAELRSVRPVPTLRAVFAREADAFETALGADARAEAVRRTHQSDAAAAPSPLWAHALRLSSAGATVHLEGPESATDWRWSQLTTMGQDQRVVVETKGRLVPTGHGAALILTVQRRRQSLPGGGETALLERRLTLRVERGSQPTAGSGRCLLQSVRFEERTSPPLDEPDRKPGFFWVEVDGAPYRFDVAGKDWAEHEAPFDLPVIFVIDSARTGEAVAVYQASAMQSGLGHRRVAVVEPGEELGNVQLDVHSMGVRASEQGLTTPWVKARLPMLEPFVAAKANLDTFVLKDPTHTPGEVFAERIDGHGTSAILARFDGETGAGFLTPHVSVRALSRRRGALGAVGGYDGSNFDPDAFFDASAVLMGSLPLGRVLAPFTPTGPEDPELPGLTRNPDTGAVVFALKTERLRNAEHPDRGVVLFTSADVDHRDWLPEPDEPSTMAWSIRADPGPPEVGAMAEVTNVAHQWMLMKDIVGFRTRIRSILLESGKPREVVIDGIDVAGWAGVLLAGLGVALGDWKNEAETNKYKFKFLATTQGFVLSVEWQPVDDPSFLLKGGLSWLNVSITISFTFRFVLVPLSIVFGFEFASPRSPFLIGVLGGPASPARGGGGSIGFKGDLASGDWALDFSIQFVIFDKIEGSILGVEYKYELMFNVGLWFTFGSMHDTPPVQAILHLGGMVKVASLELAVDLTATVAPVCTGGVLALRGTFEAVVAFRYGWFCGAFGFKVEGQIEFGRRSREELSPHAIDSESDRDRDRDAWRRYIAAFVPPSDPRS